MPCVRQQSPPRAATPSAAHRRPSQYPPAASGTRLSHALTPSRSLLAACPAQLLLISFFWGHKVIDAIATTTVASVVAWWYFEPESASRGAPCCRPVTCISFKRACTNYLGSIALGSLVLASAHVPAHPHPHSHPELASVCRARGFD